MIIARQDCSVVSGANVRNGWEVAVRLVDGSEQISPEADNPLPDAFPCSERERRFRAASGVIESATAAHLADVDPGSIGRYLP